MEKEMLEKWEQIYYFALEIARFEPWEQFGEKDILALIPKGKREEHYFSFLGQTFDQYGIAIYQNGYSYFRARERLHGPNPKKEPVFLLQDAIILLWGDREDVSRENYAIMKELGLKCRGRGGWPYFERYRVGYAPQAVTEEELDTLLDDLGNLMMMVRAVAEGKVEVDFENRKVLTRCYSKADDMFYTFAADLGPTPKSGYTSITMEDNPWLQKLRDMRSRGTIALDWSYLPTAVKEGKTKIIPRLLLAVDTRSGYVMKSELLAASDKPYDDLLDILGDIAEEYGKPSTIEICDPEIEAYISDLCQKAGIHLVMRRQLKQVTIVRKGFLKNMFETT